VATVRVGEVMRQRAVAYPNLCPAGLLGRATRRGTPVLSLAAVPSLSAAPAARSITSLLAGKPTKSLSPPCERTFSTYTTFPGQSPCYGRLVIIASRKATGGLIRWIPSYFTQV